MISTILYSWKYILLEKVTESINPWQSAAMIMSLILIGSLVLITVKRIPPPKLPAQYFWLAVSSVCQMTYVCLLMFSLLYIPAGNVSALLNTSLILVGPFEWLILKEPLRRLTFVFACTSFIGVVFIVRPSFLFKSTTAETSEENVYLGSGMAIVTAFALALLYTAIRKQSQLNIHIFITMFTGAIVTFSTTTVLCSILGHWQIPSINEWMYAAISGCCYFAAQMLLYVALSLEKATVINIILTFEIVIIYLLHFLLFHAASHWSAYVGASLIMGSCFGIIFMKGSNTINTGTAE